MGLYVDIAFCGDRSGPQSLGWTAARRADLWQNVKDAPRGSADRRGGSSMTVHSETEDTGQRRR